MRAPLRTRKRHGPGKSPVAMSGADYYKFLVRAIEVLPMFDRTGLSIMGKIPYGTVSGRLSELENEGYIRATGTSAAYTESRIKRNPDLVGHKLNLGTAPTKCAATYTKTEKWSEFMTRWRAYLLGVLAKQNAKDKEDADGK